MPSPALLQSLGYSIWTLLFALSLGSFATVVAGRLWTDATKGYLGFTALCSALLGALALLVDVNLAEPAALAAIDAAPGLDLARRLGLAVFSVLALGYIVVIRRGERSPLVGLGGVVAGIAAGAVAAFGWTGDLALGIPLLIQYLVLAAATGGSLAALLLGHWYLVTPRLGERPLVLAARALTWVVFIQLLLFLTWATMGVTAGAGAFPALIGSSALLVWLRLLVGIVFPLALAWMALKTARTRSMESATGLLYLAVAAIMAGTIVATQLFYGEGLLV
ncbi:MAG: hypothetical protein H0W07_09405 [Chloroflexi bacterium]|nr:hypothetical protein [Chloroflexota bacterium]